MNLSTKKQKILPYRILNNIKITKIPSEIDIHGTI